MKNNDLEKRKVEAIEEIAFYFRFYFWARVILFIIGIILASAGVKLDF